VKTAWLGIVCTVVTGVALAGADVSTLSLLKEMTDREALARFPEPAYTQKSKPVRFEGVVGPSHFRQ